MKAWVAVTGNIGTGKTALAATLGDELGWEVHEGATDPNPYLERFYGDMARWAFHSQLHFMVSAIRVSQQICERAAGAVQDRSLYEHYHVFARDLHDQGLMSDDEWETLGELYYAVDELLAAPDLLVHLKAPTALLHERTRRSPRAFEQGISPEYLERLDARYEAMLDVWTRSPVLVLPADEYDVSTQEGTERAVEEVLRALGPLQATLFDA